MKHFFLYAFFLPVLGCLCPPLLAGPDYTVSGVVHDSAGGRVPHAHVAVHGIASQAAIESESDDLGEFRVQVEGSGSYQVEIAVAGFQPLSATAELTEAQPTANLDLTLQIAATAQTVEVTADALAAETTSTQLGETLESKKIENVPLNGRSFTDLMAVQPGIVPMNTAQPGAVVMTGVATTPPSGDANPGNLSISGQREASNGFRVNGADVEEDVNMGTSIVPNLDAIESFRVLTSNFDAEYGNSSGGQVLVVTKSGTAQWHGSAFEFLRNTALDARNYFSQDRAAYRQNQFGGTIGGAPFSKNLTLFADHQGTRLTEGIDTGNIAVPSQAERSGSFAQNALTGCVSGPYLASLLSKELGASVAANDPYSPNSTGCTAGRPAVFPTSQIPQSAWSAPAKFLLASIPQQNAGTGVFSTADQAETLQDNKGALRADWVHHKGTLTGYYFIDGYSLVNPYPTGSGGASVPGFSATSNGLAQLLSIGHAITFGDATLNEFHMSYMRNANAVGQPQGGIGPSLISQGFTGIVPLQASTEGIANVAFNDFTMGVDTTALVQAENIYEVADAFSRIIGSHGLKFGAEMHSNQINTHPDVVFNGSFAFNGSETGVDFADFLLGVTSSYTQGQANSFYNRNLYAAAFAQDSWKLSSELTFNYGVRWDRIRPWLEKYNQLQTMVKGEQSKVFPDAPLGLVFPGDAGVPRSLASARNDFAPRAGIAWSPVATTGWLHNLTGGPGQTSIRTGYGIFYTAYEGLSAGIMSANPPYGYTYTSAAPPLFASPFTVAASGANVDAGQGFQHRFPLQKVAYGASVANPDSSVIWAQFEPLVGIPAVDPADVTPYAQHWMASVERQFNGAALISLSYIGTSTHHLLVLEEANPANPALCLSLGSAVCGPFNEQAARTQFGPAFGSVELQRTIANANYNALEATAKTNMHGLDLLASYTFSKSIDQSAGLPEPVNPVNPSLSRGLSSFDLRHNLVTSFHYALPGPKPGSRLNWIASGWAVAGIARFTSGLPVTLLNNNDTSLLGTIPNGINNNGVDTPAWSGKSLSIHTNPRGNVPVFDASQLTLPALGTMGNARRRFFSGPGLENLDATISRTVSLHDGQTIEFRAEAFNALNHAQFFGPASVEGNISSTTFGQAVSAMPPRLAQVALRYRF
ncbi:MAG: carboxypeptidase regulatory-like domain-containing protein [Terracidiphilus sp.]